MRSEYFHGVFIVATKPFRLEAIVGLSPRTVRLTETGLLVLGSTGHMMLAA